MGWQPVVGEQRPSSLERFGGTLELGKDEDLGDVRCTW